jgi:hypothetical protein
MRFQKGKHPLDHARISIQGNQRIPVRQATCDTHCMAGTSERPVNEYARRVGISLLMEFEAGEDLLDQDRDMD